MFDLDTFLADVTGCVEETDVRGAAKQVVERALATPNAIADAIAPARGGLALLHHSPELTVINFGWAPQMQLMPHDHRMWAIIGIYTGGEDNQFYRRGANRELVETAGRRLAVGDVCVLGSEAIHAVANPTTHVTGAIHVYGGDFVNQPRSQWGPGDLVERPFDMTEVMRQFEEANIAAGLGAPGAPEEPLDAEDST